MAHGYHLTRRFSRLYGAAGVWAVAGGGILTLTSGQFLFGSVLIAFSLILLVLIATGRILKERDYTRTDMLFLFFPTVGFVLIAAVYFAVFPSSYLVLAYMAVFIVLSLLAIIEARGSTSRESV